MKKRLMGFTIGTLMALGAGTATAATAVFDFEGVAPGNYGSSLTLFGPGINLTITRDRGPIEIATRTYPPGWGLNALSPFLDTNGSEFFLTFSALVTSISVDVGDFAPSDPDSFTLDAGTGSDSGSQGENTGFPTFSTLSLSEIDTFTAQLSGGSADFPQSVFWDNITVAFVPAEVPEPAPYALLLAGLAALGLRLVRRKSSALS